MKLGVVGKPNTGKSTFFKAATRKDVAAENYPFTTIETNKGVAFATTPCPCTEFDVSCDPNNARCVDGTRFVPINLLDIAGLVPGASEGKGMGNEFLDAIREADAMIHVIDAAGMTNEKGEPVDEGAYDPMQDVTFVEEEFDAWMRSLVQENWGGYMRTLRSQDEKVDAFLADKLSGLGITIQDVRDALRETAHPSDPNKWEDEDFKVFVTALRTTAKPHLYACNKMDLPSAADNLERLREEYPDQLFIPMSARSELMLRKAAEQGAITYTPGDSGFDITAEVSDAQKQGLEQIRDIMETYGSTGVQEVLDRAVFDLMDMIVVYPVEDDSKLTNKQGDVLPDAILLQRGSTPVDLAYAIHSDIGDDYVKAIDARSGQTIAKDTELETGAVIRIVT